MVYKDKDKQKEAGKERQRRYRDKAKGVTKGVTSEGVTPQGVTEQTDTLKQPSPLETVEDFTSDGAVVEPCMRPDYVCPILEDQCKPNINYGPYMTALELEAASLKANRVSKPGDEDYDGICTPEAETRENTENDS